MNDFKGMKRWHQESGRAVKLGAHSSQVLEQEHAWRDHWWTVVSCIRGPWLLLVFVCVSFHFYPPEWNKTDSSFFFSLTLQGHANPCIGTRGQRCHFVILSTLRWWPWCFCTATKDKWAKEDYCKSWLGGMAVHLHQDCHSGKLQNGIEQIRRAGRDPRNVAWKEKKQCLAVILNNSKLIEATVCLLAISWLNLLPRAVVWRKWQAGSGHRCT